MILRGLPRLTNVSAHSTLTIRWKLFETISVHCHYRLYLEFVIILKMVSPWLVLAAKAVKRSVREMTLVVPHWHIVSHTWQICQLWKTRQRLRGKSTIQKGIYSAWATRQDQSEMRRSLCATTPLRFQHIFMHWTTQLPHMIVAWLQVVAPPWTIELITFSN